MPKCLECGHVASRLSGVHFRNKCTGNISNSDEYKKKYPGARLVDEDIAKKTAITKEKMISLYGEEEGLIRWDSYRNKQSISNTFEYKQQHHGWTKEQFDDFNKSRAVTLDLCIQRYGEKEGNERWHKYCAEQSYTNTLGYYTEKYGDEAQKKWEDYNKEKGKSSSIEWVMQKYNVNQSEAEKILLIRHNSNQQHISEAEKKFINELEKLIGRDIKYTYKTRQFSMWDHLRGNAVFYDITESSNKKIIEFHGDYWHCNPIKYSENFYHSQIKKTAKEIWQRDMTKKQTAIDRGFSIMIIWESEYKENPEKVLNEAKEWLMLSDQK